MKKAIFAALVVLVPALALSQERNEQQLSKNDQADQIAEAIRELARAGVLQKDERGNVIINKAVIDALKKAGALKSNSKSKASTECMG